MKRRVKRGSKRGNAGFTLIELLVVIIIIAILATIAIPTFLGQREKAQDGAAYTLVRNGLTEMQTALVDTGDYTLITTAILTALDPGIHWVQSATSLVSTAPPSIADPIGAFARANQIAFYIESPTVVDLATVSASGNSFGIKIDTVVLGQTGYVKVRQVDGTAQLGW